LAKYHQLKRLMPTWQGTLQIYKILATLRGKCAHTHTHTHTHTMCRVMLEGRTPTWDGVEGHLFCERPSLRPLPDVKHCKKSI
jgi:hypothetical protein